MKKIFILVSVIVMLVFSGFTASALDLRLRFGVPMGAPVSGPDGYFLTADGAKLMTVDGAYFKVAGE